MGYFFAAGVYAGTVELNSGWQFRKAGDTAWIAATVPGTVHTDLFNQQKIPDPFFGDNEKLVQWIDTCIWEYQTIFTASEIELSQNSELVFEGLDTYADVFLNGTKIISADNMFRTWKIDCKKFLKPENNQLLVRFFPAVQKGKEQAAKLKYILPGDEKVFTRKAQYHYGWDWGPRLVTCGIWKPVKIIYWSSFKINDVRLITDELSESVAVISAEISVTVAEPTEIFFHLSVKETPQEATKIEQVEKGEGLYRITFVFPNPKRWWCNGMGEPFLYHFTIRASGSRGPSVKLEIPYGLRTIQLIQEPDKKGKSFYFKLNGRPVFMKGANWIPADNFIPRVTPDKYRKLLIDAKEANMNMLRVWGGGIYENDIFYDLCDSLGILVWQDFMFACAMYPGDSAFTGNVNFEINDNITRLRNHPSIALWCGNNEVDEGWNNWGWQKQYGYSGKDSSKIWNDYVKLFHEGIPNLLSQLDQGRPYHPSSPTIGWGRKESLEQGDVHYWGVWWGMEPFEIFRKKTGRFMSEYGFQGMPSMNTIRSFTTEDERNVNSASIKNHQKHQRGFETIDYYMKDWYKQPKDFESYVYVSQLLQTEGMRIAIESHRSAKPYCMGTLYWQLNDCWPVTSWSSLDYAGTWKAFHYTARSCFQKYLITVQDSADSLSVYVVSDDTAAVAGLFHIRMLDFKGSVLWQESANAIASPEKVTLVYSKSKSGFFVNKDSRSTLLEIKMNANDSLLTSTLYYFNKPAELLLEDPGVKMSVENQDSNYVVTLTSKSLAKNVFLEIKGEAIHFSDNYFDLLPNTTKKIFFSSPTSPEKIKENLAMNSLVDSYLRSEGK